MYVTPIWVHNTAAVLDIDRDTFFVGIGGRLRLGATMYVVAEVTPRAAGYSPEQAEFAFGIEKRAGGHMFQLNFGNSQGTTFAQTARGGFRDSLFLGFNLARKFFLTHKEQHTHETRFCPSLSAGSRRRLQRSATRHRRPTTTGRSSRRTC